MKVKIITTKDIYVLEFKSPNEIKDFQNSLRNTYMQKSQFVMLNRVNTESGNEVWINPSEIVSVELGSLDAHFYPVTTTQIQLNAAPTAISPEELRAKQAQLQTMLPAFEAKRKADEEFRLAEVKKQNEMRQSVLPKEFYAEKKKVLVAELDRLDKRSARAKQLKAEIEGLEQAERV